MRKMSIFPLAAFGLVLLMGCTPQTQTVPVDKAGRISSSAENLSDSGVVSSGVVAVAVPNNLKEGMAYGDLRKKVIEGKWSPMPHPNCKREVIGANFEKVCSSDHNLCKQCDELPELSECSGDGHCLMEFSDEKGSRLLTVATYGDIRDAKVEGEKSGLRVSWWDVK